jgi:hypothetical protein
LITAPGPRVRGVGAHELIANVLEVAVTIVGALVLLCFALAAVEALIEQVSRLVASRQPDPEETGGPPVHRILHSKPELTLLVRHGSDSDVLHPSVQLRGGIGPPTRSIRLELKDEHERLRVSVSRRFSIAERGRELQLPAFTPPEGASVEEALGWHWDLVLEHGENEPFRWREHPRAVEGTNAEAELRCPVA